ncbi:MAG: Imm63 family immunity protein, partial [Lachnospiraceae bacterium]|nr:Imm63 family immunity protein [Lachnospiraceae bacterium]
FAEGTDNSVEGTYIFNKNNEYHILFTEKGKIRSDIVTDEKREVLWNAVEIISTNIIMNFAISNREKGKDFRRALFAKEKEIFSLFGQDFQKRKDEEIEEILKKNPYNDI